MSRRPRAILLAALLSGSVMLVACGNDDAVDTDDAASATTEGGGEVGTAPPEDIEVTGAIDEKPVIELNGAGPVDELYTEDLIEGAGDEVAAGDTVEVQYVGVQLDGTEFDASWDRGQTASFSLDGVIAGWTQGIPGMKIGGRRLLVIPADLAYGDDASSGRPAGTLVFVVDMVSIPAHAPEPVDPQGDGSGIVSVTGAFGEAPVVELNGVAPATDVQTTDVIVGEGTEITDTSSISMQILALLLDGSDAGSTWTNGGEPTSFAMADVPAGLRTALVGMRPGGRRLVVAPSSAAQPEGSAAPSSPGDTIVFVFDLVEVTA